MNMTLHIENKKLNTLRLFLSGFCLGSNPRHGHSLHGIDRPHAKTIQKFF